jgi:hypothetical protein
MLLLLTLNYITISRPIPFPIIPFGSAHLNKWCNALWHKRIDSISESCFHCVFKIIDLYIYVVYYFMQIYEKVSNKKNYFRFFLIFLLIIIQYPALLLFYSNYRFLWFLQNLDHILLYHLLTCPYQDHYKLQDRTRLVPRFQEVLQIHRVINE